MENKRTLPIPETVLEHVQNLLVQAKELMSPYSIALTPSDRRNLPKMGEKSYAFVEKAHDFAVKNAALRPPFLDMDAFNTDYDNAHALSGLQNIACQLNKILDDTAMVAGSESYQASLAFYNYIKIAASQNVPGAQSIYDELRTRFPRGKRNSIEIEAEDINDTAKKDINNT